MCRYGRPAPSQRFWAGTRAAKRAQRPVTWRMTTASSRPAKQALPSSLRQVCDTPSLLAWQVCRSNQFFTLCSVQGAEQLRHFHACVIALLARVCWKGTMSLCTGSQEAAMQRAASGATSLGRAATHAAAEVLQQDEHSTEWRTQRKHFFVLTNAGVPILFLVLTSSWLCLCAAVMSMRCRNATVVLQHRFIRISAVSLHMRSSVMLKARLAHPLRSRCD